MWRWFLACKEEAQQNFMISRREVDQATEVSTKKNFYYIEESPTMRELWQVPDEEGDWIQIAPNYNEVTTMFFHVMCHALDQD